MGGYPGGVRGAFWDNRAVLHRATPYDTVRYKRLMQRTTISGDPAELAPVAG